MSFRHKYDAEPCRIKAIYEFEIDTEVFEQELRREDKLRQTIKRRRLALFYGRGSIQ